MGATVSLVSEVEGGEWTSSDDNVATVDNMGIVAGIAEGSASITHRSAGSNGETITTVTQIIVNSLPFTVSIIPNPNTGAFTVQCKIGSNTNEPITLEIMNMAGQVVYSSELEAAGGTVSKEVFLNRNLANGMYLLNVKSGTESKVLHFVIMK